MKTPKIVVALALVLGLATSASAADLTLTGDSAVDWNKTASNKPWTNSVGTAVAFADGNNVLISSEHFKGPSLTMKARVNPGDVVFDIDRTLEFIDGGATHGLGPTTKSFTKRGAGTLIFKNSLSNQNNGDGGTGYGNGMTNGINIVEGEIACQTRNWHNTLGPRAVPFSVWVRNGASLTFLDGNQTGVATASECGIKILLENGGRLNICTNKTSTSGTPNNILCVNTLELAGGDIVAGAGAYNDNTDLLGGKCTMKIFNALAFSGETPHAFGFPNGRYPGYKHYSSSFLPGKISLNPYAPVEFRVENIDNGDGVDTYLCGDLSTMFAWGTNSVGEARGEIVKTGAGTLCITNTVNGKYYNGDLTIREGVLSFDDMSFFASDGGQTQTITVLTNGTLRANIRNVVRGTLTDKPKVDVVVDHGTFDFSPTSATGNFRARNFTFDDATIVLKSQGLSTTQKYIGVLTVMDTLSFKGSTPYVLQPDATLGSTTGQAINIYTNTTIEVADITGDLGTDVTIAYPLWNYNTNGTNNAGFLTGCGFVKTGAGTLSIACPADTSSGYASRLVSGVVTVSNGVLRVDGSLVTPSRMEVAAGAYLGGTGTVANVSLEAGAGFSAPAGETSPLTVSGDLVLPATGVIDIANLDGVDERDLPETKFVTATGTLSGAENLENWTVKVNGSVSSKWRLMVDDGVVKAKVKNGLTIVFR